MKKPLLTLILTLTLAGGLFAIPLTVEVIKESEKIADTIRAFDKEGPGLGDKATGASPSLDEETPEWRRRINAAILKRQGEMTAILRDFGVPLLNEQGELISP